MENKELTPAEIQEMHKTIRSSVESTDQNPPENPGTRQENATEGLPVDLDGSPYPVFVENEPSDEQDENMDYEAKCESLQDENSSLNIENAICRSALADIQRTNVRTVQACNEATTKLFKLGKAYGKTKGSNERLQRKLKEKEEQLKKATVSLQYQKALNQKLMALVEEVTTRKEQAKQEILQSVGSILDAAFDTKGSQINNTKKPRQTKEKKKKIMHMKNVIAPANSSSSIEWAHPDSDSDNTTVQIQSLIKDWNDSYNQGKDQVQWFFPDKLLDGCRSHRRGG